VPRKIADIQAVKAAALRATLASARLERREIPKDYVRSERVAKFLSERRRSV
jgi:hypothetical protein